MRVVSIRLRAAAVSAIGRSADAPPPSLETVKEDSCGGCRNNDTLDYVTMHEAIVAAGRPMVQTDEGAPDNANCSATNACGNAKRVSALTHRARLARCRRSPPLAPPPTHRSATTFSPSLQT